MSASHENDKYSPLTRKTENAGTRVLLVTQNVVTTKNINLVNTPGSWGFETNNISNPST